MRQSDAMEEFDIGPWIAMDYYGLLHIARSLSFQVVDLNKLMIGGWPSVMMYLPLFILFYSEGFNTTDFEPSSC